MIAFGTAITDPEAYRRYARPSIDRVAEPDSRILAFAAVGSSCRSYNLLLDQAAREEQLEALVLVDQQVQITGDCVCSRVRDALADPAVGAAGPIGASGVRSIAWWDGDVSAAATMLCHQEYGGGTLPALHFTDVRPPPAPVDVLDGLLLVLSPWAVREIRFDEALAVGYGYELDFALRVRAAGRTLITTDIPTTRHQKLALLSEAGLWAEGHVQVAGNWESELRGAGAPAPDWRARARRAEAEREAARTIAYSTAARQEASVAPLERRLDELSSTLSWRVTEPLRRLNTRLRRR